jgi:hypothetical protein
MQALVLVNDLCVEDCNACIRDEVAENLCMCHCHEACEEWNITVAAGYASERSSYTELLACISLSKS